jgi:hypothetical protein
MQDPLDDDEDWSYPVNPFVMVLVIVLFAAVLLAAAAHGQL